VKAIVFTRSELGKNLYFSRKLEFEIN